MKWENYEKMVFLLERRKFDKAFEVINEHLASYPEDALVFCLKSACCLNMRKVEEANLWAKRAMELAPDFTMSLNQMAAIHIEKDEFVKAHELLDLSLNQEAQQSDVFMWKAIIHIQTAEPAKSEHFANLCLELTPFHFVAKNLIAINRINENKYLDAKTIILSVLEENPHEVFSLFNLGVVEYYLNNKERAGELFIEAFLNDPYEWSSEFSLLIIKNSEEIKSFINTCKENKYSL